MCVGAGLASKLAPGDVAKQLKKTPERMTSAAEYLRKKAESKHPDRYQSSGLSSFIDAFS